MKVRYAVPSNSSRISYVGNGSTTVFAVPFVFFEASDLTVLLVNSTTLAETTQVITTNYTVSGGDGSTGNVTMLAAPSAGYNLVVFREIPFTQEIDYQQNDGFPADVNEEGLDRGVMLAQQANRRALQSPKLPETFDPEGDDPITMPLPEAGQVLVGKSDGSGWENSPAVDLDFVTLQTAFTVDTLADLKALTYRPEVVIVRTGQAAGGWRWAASDTSTADDALVATPTSGDAGRYKRIYTGPIQATWFGFLANGLSASGSANSTALQAAVAAGIAAASIVELPEGTAYLASTVAISGSVKLRGKGWGSILRPTADGIGTVLNVTGSTIEISDLLVNGDTIVSPTFTALKVNTSGGFVRADNLYIYGCGVGIDMPAGNACRFSNLRIQACPTCVKSGGASGSFPGDTTWEEVVLIPTSTGTGWIIDGNTNAQYVHRLQIIGGAINLHVRGAGSGTATPDGILQTSCNYTASSGPVVKIVKCWNFQMAASVVGGSTGDDGILIDPAATADVDGVLLDGCQVRANYKCGINWAGGANVQVIGGQVYGNSEGGSGTYSNIYVGASAKGLFMASGIMAGMSKSGEVFANIAGPSKYGIELASGALTDTTNFPGRVFITKNQLEGNTTGTILDASAPTGVNKVIDNGNAFGSTPLSNALGADITMSNTALYYDGPSVAQGTSGVWYVSGSITLAATAGNPVNVKLWDGTTVIASAQDTAPTVTGVFHVKLSGVITSPAGNLRISARSPSVGATMYYNVSGNGKDSNITAFRVG